MKRLFLITVIFTSIFIASCGKKDSAAELAQLKAQREQLNARIQQIEQSLNGNGVKTASGKHVYVDVQELTYDTFQHFIQVQGTITSDNNILLPAQSSGVVKTIHVEPGDKIEEGQLLAELDDIELLSQKSKSEAALNMARAELEFANLDLARKRQLAEKEMISNEELEIALQTETVLQE